MATFTVKHNEQVLDSTLSREEAVSLLKEHATKFKARVHWLGVRLIVNTDEEIAYSIGMTDTRESFRIVTQS